MFDISTAVLFGILFCACAILCIVSIVLCIGALGRTHRIEKTLRDIECREIEIEILQRRIMKKIKAIKEHLFGKCSKVKKEPKHKKNKSTKSPTNKKK